MQQDDMEISNEEIISEEVHSLFHDACKAGNIRLCRTLIETGRADVNLMDSSGHTPLHKSILSKSLQVTSLLLKCGAEVNQCDREGNTGLHYASYNGFYKLVKCLCYFGANPNSQNKDGTTPLHLAARYGYQKSCQILVCCGSDINVQDRVGQTPLHVAALHNQRRIVTMLLNFHARIDIVDAILDNPMHIAVSMGHADIVKQLLRANKDRLELDCFSRDTSRPNENVDIRSMTNAQNEKPFDIALCQRCPEILRIMASDFTEKHEVSRYSYHRLHPARLALEDIENLRGNSMNGANNDMITSLSNYNGGDDTTSSEEDLPKMMRKRGYSDNKNLKYKYIHSNLNETTPPSNTADSSPDEDFEKDKLNESPRESIHDEAIISTGARFKPSCNVSSRNVDNECNSLTPNESSTSNSPPKGNTKSNFFSRLLSKIFKRKKKSSAK
ncbi:unnamed protein product [Trichobilharzia szidati]|nr:unnamed protein product [Trichobilharzia szidati]